MRRSWRHACARRPRDLAFPARSDANVPTQWAAIILHLGLDSAASPTVTTLRTCLPEVRGDRRAAFRAARVVAGEVRGDDRHMKTMKLRSSRAGCAAAVVVCAWSATANAQTRATPGAALNRFEPSETGSNWFANESLDLRGDFRPAFGVVGDFAYKPYVLDNADGTENTAIIASQLYVHHGASLNQWNRLRLGVSLPVAVEQDGESKTVGSRQYVAPTDGGVGDLRISADLRLVGAYGDPFTMALGGRFWTPTGDSSQYLGDGQVRVGPRLSIAGDVAAFAYAAGLGVVYRANDTPFNGHPTGTEVNFAAAAGVRVANRALLLGPELQGSTIVSEGGAAFGDRTTPLALLLGGHYDAGDVRFGLGAGPGLSRAAGTAQLRALGSIEWMPAVEKAAAAPRDRDRDGIADGADACPDVAGVATNDPRTNGCPPDRDGDGVLDTVDACPDAAGVRTDDPKTNGCPPDRDGDGVLDHVDACPDVAGAKTDDPKTNGCPPDRDGDSVVDGVDACPDVAGVKSDDPKTNGCPSDRDKDGIVDNEDACPDFAGPKHSDAKKNGCPLARVEAGQVKILEQIKFKTNSAEIVDSQPILDAVKATFKEHPEIKHVRIQGHTDNAGSAAYNKALSTRRAASVKAALIKAGIDARSLSSEGFGFERPIADNGTDEGRAANRRVEFHIEDLATTPAAPTTVKPGTKGPTP
jgi:outer membrane protein OmpA-like peptidoglycan-associated protein